MLFCSVEENIFNLPKTIHMTMALPPIAITSISAKTRDHTSCCHHDMTRCGCPCRLLPPEEEATVERGTMLQLQYCSSGLRVTFKVQDKLRANPGQSVRVLFVIASTRLVLSHVQENLFTNQYVLPLP